MNQYGIRLRKRVLDRMSKEQRKLVWDGLRKAVATLKASKGSQRIHTEDRQ